jgi:choline dehydrogenase-like flavoprotein
VGGTTVHWAGASLRIQEHEFKAKTHYGAIDGTTLMDWPLMLAELEPYYAKAESIAARGAHLRRDQPKDRIARFRASAQAFAACK